MNNTNTTVIQTLIGKLPTTIFFEQIPDRQQALKYLQWLKTNIPESNTVNQEQLCREVISKELRIVGMKIVEIEILLMVALNTITINDFTIDSNTLIKKLISENPDNYELDIMYRIMAQIMTKLPRDLKERVTGEQKLNIFQKISNHLKIDNKLLEKFISLDPSINTPISMTLDNGDYNTLNKKYLDELQKYEEEKGYINSDSLEYAKIAKNSIDTTPTLTNDILKTTYIDDSPEFMLGVNDNILYYYDSSSGTLSNIKLNSNQNPVSIEDLKTILINNKVNKNEIQNLLNNLQPVTTQSSLINTPTESSNIFDNISSYFSTAAGSGATATTSATDYIATQSNTKDLPIPPQYMLDSKYGKRDYQGSSQYKGNPYGPNQYSGNPYVSTTYGGNPYGGNPYGGTTYVGNPYGPKEILSRDITTYKSNNNKIDTKTRHIIEKQIEYDNNYSKNYYYSQKNNLNNKFKERKSSYVPFFTQYSSSDKKSFMNRTNKNDIYPGMPRPESFTNMNEDIFLNKIKNDNQNIENVALGFVTTIILIFLLAIFNSLR